MCLTKLEEQEHHINTVDHKESEKQDNQQLKQENPSSSSTETSKIKIVESDTRHPLAERVRPEVFGDVAVF